MLDEWLKRSLHHVLQLIISKNHLFSWNRFPPYIKNTCTLKTFDSKLKISFPKKFTITYNFDRLACSQQSCDGNNRNKVAKAALASVSISLHTFRKPLLRKKQPCSAGRPWSCIFRNWSRFGSYNVYLNDTRISYTLL